MKLRIKGDSIRLRLMQTDVQNLQEQGQVTARLHFPAGNALVYKLEVAEAYNVVYTGDTLLVSIPEKAALDWMASEELSLKRHIELAEGQLFLLIEKDLACIIEREHEDESDAFPNPLSEG